VDGSSIRLRSFDDAITGFALTGTAPTALGLSPGAAQEDSIGSFRVSGASDLPELGLTGLAAGLDADDADLLILVSKDLDGDPDTENQPFKVKLDGVTDLAGIVSEISSQTNGLVSVELNEGRTGLTLVDSTFLALDLDEFGNVQSNPNAAKFAVMPANASAAAVGLGILGVDSLDESNLDGKIDGRQVGGTRLTDRFFIEDSSGIRADLTLTTDPEGVNASASFGFVGVTVDGAANLTGAFAAGFQDPTKTGAGADGRVTLSELLDAFEDGELLSVLETPGLTGFGEVDLGIALSPDTDLFGDLSGAGIDFEFNLGDLPDKYRDALSFPTANRTGEDTFTLPGDHTTGVLFFDSATRTATNSFTLAGDQTAVIRLGSRVLAKLVDGTIVETAVQRISHENAATSVQVADAELSDEIASVEIHTNLPGALDFDAAARTADDTFTLAGNQVAQIPVGAQVVARLADQSTVETSVEAISHAGSTTTVKVADAVLSGALSSVRIQSTIPLGAQVMATLSDGSTVESFVKTIRYDGTLANGGTNTTTVTISDPAFKDPETGQALTVSKVEILSGRAPEIDFDFEGLANLEPFANLDFSFAAIIDALLLLSDFLGQFEQFDFLDEPIPLVDTSVNDVLGFLDDFSDALDALQKNPTGTIQLLEGKLKEAFGVLAGNDLSALGFEDSNASPAGTGRVVAKKILFDAPSDDQLGLPEQNVVFLVGVDDRPVQLVNVATASDKTTLFNNLQTALDDVFGAGELMAEVGSGADDGKLVIRTANMEALVVRNIVDLSLVTDSGPTDSKDDDRHILRVALGIGAGFSESVGLEIPDLDLPLGDNLTLAGSAGFEARGGGALILDFGIELQDPTNVYVFEDTGLRGVLDLGADDLAFRAALGGFGLSIAGGKGTLPGADGTAIAASVDLGFEDGTFQGGPVLITDLELGGVPGFVDAHTFTLPGDQTDAIGDRVTAQLAGGPITASVESRSFDSGNNRTTIELDSGGPSLDATLSVVSSDGERFGARIVDADTLSLPGNQTGRVLPGALVSGVFGTSPFPSGGAEARVASVSYDSASKQTTVDLEAEAPPLAGTLVRVTFDNDIFGRLDADLSGDIALELPVFFPTASRGIGSITVQGDIAKALDEGTFLVLSDPQAPDPTEQQKTDNVILDVREVVEGITLNLDDLSLLDQILFLVDGVDLVLGGVQDALDGEIFGFKMPLIGDSLSDGAEFIGEFRAGFLTDFRSELERASDPNENFVKDLLFDLLGPSGLDVLIATDTSGSARKDTEGNFIDGTIDDIKSFNNLAEVTEIAEAELWWKMKIGQNLVDAGADIGLDIGIPGLGLETEGEIELDIDWELDLGFGLSGEDTFFLFIDDEDELLLDLGVTLPNAMITGTLGFLELQGTNKDVDGDGDQTHLNAQLAIDLGNKSDAGDTRLGLSEIGKLGFEAEVGAEASVELGLELGFSSDRGGFPRVVSDFILDWAIADDPATPVVERISLTNAPPDFDFGRAIQEGLQKLAFENVNLDVGSYLNEVLRPIVEKVKEYTEPVQPIIDVITTPIPVIDSLGLEITMLDLAKLSGKVDPAFIDAVQRILQVVEQIQKIPIPEGDQALIVPFGDFTIIDVTDPVLTQMLENELGSNFDLGSEDFDPDAIASRLDSTLAGLLKGLPGGLDDILGSIAGEAIDVVKGLAEENTETKDKFSLPILEDPTSVFGLMMGNPVTLVAYDMAPLTFEFDWSQFFSIWGPLGVSINLEAEIIIDFAFGYDTQGIVDFVDSDFRNPLLISNGLFVSDHPSDVNYDGSGEDPPELEFNGGAWAAAELNLGIARGGVGGGIFIEVDFNLNDPDDDGRVRLGELTTNFINQTKAPSVAERFLAPLAIFDVTGEITAELFAFVKFKLGFFTVDKKFQITEPFTLVEFDVDFFRPPTLATELDNGDLLLNIGEFADQRLFGDTSDFGEHIFIEDAGAGQVAIWSDNIADAGSNAKQIYSVSGNIIAAGGEGDDIIDLSPNAVSQGVGAGIGFELEGGAGNDILKGGDGGGIIRGDEGDDELRGGAGVDLIIGDVGNDEIHAGGGDDFAFGDGGEVPEDFLSLGTGFVRGLFELTDGEDLIFGEAGSDVLIGSGGADRIFGDGETADPDDGDDVIIGEGALLEFNSPVASVAETEDGSQGFPDFLAGGGGADLIFGGRGDDEIYGNAGSDELRGQSGFDLIDGGDDDDVIFGDGGQTFPGPGGIGTSDGDESSSTRLHDPDADFLAEGVRVGDFLKNVSEGAIVAVTRVVDANRLDTEAVGSWDSSDAAYQFISRPVVGGDADTILGGAHDDLIFAGDGNDYVQGGDGDDRIFGAGGADTLFGDLGRTVDGVLEEDSVAGTGDDQIFGEAEPDYLYGGFGNDALDGGIGGDEVRGGADIDTLISKKGSDFLDGGEGGDFYLSFLFGGIAESLSVISDSSTTDGEIDVWIVTGTVLDDVFLLRANPSGSRAFVAGINGPDRVERINYGGDLERIVINGSFGDDHFAVDDTAAEITINGEFGNDTFQIGQLFKSSRGDTLDDDGPDGVPGSEDDDGRADSTGILLPDDIFADIETTRGFLSNGISAPMTINGGLGEDVFTVFHNLAVLQLNGGGGDDTFEIRAFALVGSQEPQRERTDVTGGAGADLVMYAVNAPVNIDGGDGLDTVVVIGTEFGDDFVIRDDGVFGAGLTVNFVNIESLRVDGAEGNDRFFVQSTSEKFVTELLGGLGEDTFNMSGDAPPVVSNDLKGHSGLVLHDVESNDPRYQGQNLFGISANVGDDEEPFAVVRPSDGSTIVTEGSSVSDSYEIVLTRKPLVPVFVLALAPIPTPDKRELRAQAFRLDDPSETIETLPDGTRIKASGARVTPDGTGLTLQFTPDDWFLPQTVQVFAYGTGIDPSAGTPAGGIFTRPELMLGTPEQERTIHFDDAAFEGVHFGVINHLVQAATQTVEGTLLGVVNAENQPTVTIESPGGVNPDDLVGRELQIRAGAGKGQTRFVVAVDDTSDPGNFVLTLDQPFRSGDVPNDVSKFQINIDDALVGTMTDFDEFEDGDRSSLPPTTAPEDERTTFTDSMASFPLEDEGLRGAILHIVGGPGAGQQRLILGHIGSDTLILNGPWARKPVENQSLYRIERFQGLAIPSVQVQVNDNDRRGVIVDETSGIDVDVAGQLVPDFDTITSVIEGGDGDQLGERDVVRVRLSHPPVDDVNVRLLFQDGQLDLVDPNGDPLILRDANGDPILDGDGNPIPGLQFNPDPTGSPGSWEDFQDVVVQADADLRREGFHTSLIEFEIDAGDLANPVEDGNFEEPDDQIDRFDQIAQSDAVFFVGLTRLPVQGSVRVTIDGIDLVEADADGLDGEFRVISNKVVFVDDPGAVEARFGLIDVRYRSVRPGFDTAVAPAVLARIGDADAPTVLMRETGGSTDVIEGNTIDSAFAVDSYELVLTDRPMVQDPAAGPAFVEVRVTPDITKTTRTGGIRHDEVQVEVFGLDPGDTRVVREDFTATGGDATHLIHADADFVKAGIRIGQLVRNLSEGTVARVAEILSATELRTEPALGSGAVVDWSGDDYSFGNLKVTFGEADWDRPVQIGVRAIDDLVVDGGDTKEFAPGPHTVSGILGPVIVEGAGGSGSLSIGAPVMLPGEINQRPSSGNVVAFAPNPDDGFGAVEEMTVETQDLEAFISALDDDDITEPTDLEGLTLEMSRGQGVDLVLDPERPDDKFDRFWLIQDVSPHDTNADWSVLELHNPSQVNPADLAPSDVPDADSEYAVTTLSANFFVDETTQVDFLFVHDEDSPADSHGVLTSTRLSGLNMGPDLVIGGQRRPGGITYNDLEVLEINLGRGGNTFEVRGTHTREDGYQTWTFLNGGDDVPFGEIVGDTVTVSLNAVDQVVSTGTVKSSQNADADLGIFETTVTLDEIFAPDALAGQLIEILEDDEAPADGQRRRILGNVEVMDDGGAVIGTRLTIAGLWDFPPDGEAYRIVDEADGAFAVNTQGGDDSVDASDSSLGITIFGGLGSDTLKGGSGGDAIFGDRGRVDYFDFDDALVTRLGFVAEPIEGYVTAPVTADNLNKLVDANASFPVRDDDADGMGSEDIGLEGLYVDITDGLGFLQTRRLITGLPTPNTAKELTLAEGFDPDEDLPGPDPDDPSRYRISTVPENQTDGVVREANLLLTVDSEQGGADTIDAGAGDDQVFGGANADAIDAGAGDDLVVGDGGRLDRTRDPAAPEGLVVHDSETGRVEVRSIVDRLRTIAWADGGGDTISGGADADLMLGGADGDTLHGDDGTDSPTDLDGADLILGDNGEMNFEDGSVVHVFTTDLTGGGSDIVFGNGADDVLIGGTDDDFLDGDEGSDWIFGDQLEVARRGDGMIANPRFQTILGEMIYSRFDLPAELQGLIPPGEPGSDFPTSGDGAGELLVDGEARAYRNPDGSAPIWAEWEIVELYHTLAIQEGLVPELLGSFGDDYLAGGAGDDQIFGQLGDDTIQGDGSIDSAVAEMPAPYGGRRGPDEVIDLTPTLTGVPVAGRLEAPTFAPSFESAGDGDDYIEGNGGDDVIFGNLGQDDIVGGSSELFTLDLREERPDGSDTIFGGAGTRIDREHLVDAGNADTIVLDEVHARDSDAIAGDNANIFRPVGTNSVDGGGFLEFGYDQGRGAERIVVRGVELLDYTPGGPDFRPDKFDPTHALFIPDAHDLGAGDEVHGESGDDFIYGMTGNDVLFADSQDDDVVGGWGHDWISAGSGIDGVIGDDGRVYTGRYEALGGEPDPGDPAHYNELLNGVLKVDETDKVIRTPGDIQRAIINPDGELFKQVDLTPFNLRPNLDEGGLPLADDPAFVPQHANDIVFGGTGGDFLHGSAGDDAVSGAEALAPFFEQPVNPGDVLRFNPERVEFADYDEEFPRTKLPVFLLNFDAALPGEGDEDKLFGDLGNDWLVGGPDNDHLFGGFGADLLDADDDKDTNGGLNDGSDGPDVNIEDIAFGGAGRDVLSANTAGDRLIDWAGEFNSYLTSFAPFGAFTVSRGVPPHLFEYLYDLSEADGADPTRAADTGNPAERNGEPEGEIGLVIQKDGSLWRDQTGAPIDPQPGNIPGGPRLTLRGADFNNGSAQGFTPDSGTWTVESGRFAVAPETLGSDAVSVMHVGEYLPGYFEMQATINAGKPTAGLKSNAFLIFDYQGPDDFKFAGVNISIDKIQMGHRDATGWHVDVQTPAQLKPDQDYQVLLALNGLTATLVLDGQQHFSHAFAPRIDEDGFSHGLNEGTVGIGADNSVSRIDNVSVQILYPEITFRHEDDFTDGLAELFTALSGTWAVNGTRYEAAFGGASALASFALDVGPNSILDLETTLTADATGGFFFDRYDDGDYKFAGVLRGSDEVVIGHVRANGTLVVDALAAIPFPTSDELELDVKLRGTTVSVAVDGYEVVGHVFNAVVVDGEFGLLARGGNASFDRFEVRTDDPAFFQLPQGENLVAAGEAEALAGVALDPAALDAIVDQAIALWDATVGLDAADLAALEAVSFEVADLSGLILATTIEDTVWVDVNAAGYGWFVDTTPEDASEFLRRLPDGTRRAQPGSEAHGAMDLLSAVTHELGHVLDLEVHEELGTTLQAGERVIPFVGVPERAPGRHVVDPAALSYAVRVLAAERWADEDDEEDFVLHEIPLDPAALL
jgi:Ca2+-binding RTX toxin-like protein